MTKVLIKFFSRNPVSNVVGSIMFEPELLVPVGFGPFLSDTMRGRLNYFFHHRELETIVADPVRLDDKKPAEQVRELVRVIRKYESGKIFIDMTDADPETAYVLGMAMAKNEGASATIFSFDLSEGKVSLIRTVRSMNLPVFPTLTASEYRYLEDGTLFDQPVAVQAYDLFRKDLDRTTVALIRQISSAYYDRPSMWIEFSGKLRKTKIGRERGKMIYELNVSELQVRDEIFRELVDRGILSRYHRKNGIHHLEFPTPLAAGLLRHISDTPMMNAFLQTARIRDYGKMAAYHDLKMTEFRYVTAIHGCCPIVITAFGEKDDALTIYEFAHAAVKFYGEPIRKIMIAPPELVIDEETAAAARSTNVEMTDLDQLSRLLELK